MHKMNQSRSQPKSLIKQTVPANSPRKGFSIDASDLPPSLYDQPSSSEWNIIPLKACTTDELQDARHHILKFHTKQDVDVINGFVKPVRMHRKDPQHIQFQLSRQEIDRRSKEKADTKAIDDYNSQNKNGGNFSNNDAAVSGMHDIGESSVDLLQVAPDGGARRHHKNLFRRKTKQVHVMNEAKRKLRYEEYYPWVIEDYTGDNVFVGSYEAASTESTHVLFVFDKNCFRMVPAEKFYKFTPRNKYATLTLEEAEARMEKNSSAPRWLMKHMDEGSDLSDVRFRNNGCGTSTTSSLKVRINHMRTVQGGANDRDSDHDDLDFEEEFADDEEAPIMDGDEEENKVSVNKIKKEMLKAAHFEGQSDERVTDDDLNDLFEIEKSRKVDKEGMKLKRVLNKTEGAVYDSDYEDSHPYVSPSDLESNENSEVEIIVKAERYEGIEHKVNSPRTRAIFIAGAFDGVVVIKATSEFLQRFPHGEWNPNARKRLIDSYKSSSAKRLKQEHTWSSPPNLHLSDSAHLNDAGANGDMVTTKEVLEIVKKNPLTTKELLLSLKSRIGVHRDNKIRIIQIVKSNLKLVEGKLQLKE